ncbi:MAG TPA: UDP-N-acetylglucosamine 1-carboxyvinyltransferase [bacterium]
MKRLLIGHSAPLRGAVAVNGAKNAVLPILAAALLTDEPCEIDGVPHVTDVATMRAILDELGVRTDDIKGAIRTRPGAGGTTASYELVRMMRASVCVLGPLLAKRGTAKVSMPGGCVIGPRPIDLHLKGLRALGASIEIEHGYIVAHATRLRGAHVLLGGAFGSSVLATANVMMAAALAEGETVIEQAACEPEVSDLADCLSAMGARIAGRGTPVLTIEGVRRLRGVRYRIIPDRIEAGTLMMAAAITGGDVLVDGARAEHLGALIEQLREAGVEIEPRPGAVRVRAPRRLRATEVTALPYPGFPTDLQAQIMALMTVAEGVSVVTEKVYPERFMHVPELLRMGAQITREGSRAVVKGVPRLSGAPVVASDLRASAGLILAGLAADNSTELRGIEHLSRGYQALGAQLVALGADIREIDDPDGGRTGGEDALTLESFQEMRGDGVR